MDHLSSFAIRLEIIKDQVQGMRKDYENFDELPWDKDYKIFRILKSAEDTAYLANDIDQLTSYIGEMPELTKVFEDLLHDINDKVEWLA